MQSTQTTILPPQRRIETSNLFTKSLSSSLLQTYNAHSSSLSPGKFYDSEYKSGFPKLYSFDTNVKSTLGMSHKLKKKFSFRNDKECMRLVQENFRVMQENTKILQENTKIIEQNKYLKSENQRIFGFLQGKQSEVHRLYARVAYLQRHQVLPMPSPATIQPQLLPISSSVKSPLEFKLNQSQSIISQLNQKISMLTQQINSLQGQNLTLSSRAKVMQGDISNYSGQLIDLKAQVQRFSTKAKQLQRRQILLKNTDDEVLRLQQNMGQFLNERRKSQVQISTYERIVERYQSQMSSLQQINTRLQDRLQQMQQKQPSTLIISQQEENVEQRWVQEGRLRFRIIILLQEINRLKQKETLLMKKEAELIQKGKQLHSYLLKAENYIQQMQKQLQNQQPSITQPPVSSDIQQKLYKLQQENSKYQALIEQLQLKLSALRQKISDNGDIEEWMTVEKHRLVVGERDFRIIILLQEISRLNHKVNQTQGYLQQAEDYIESLQSKVHSIPLQISAETSRQVVYLSQENQRLNKEIRNYNNEMTIMKLSLKEMESKYEAKQLLYREREVQLNETKERMLMLEEQIQRLSLMLREVQNKIPNIEYITSFRVPPEIEAQLVHLRKENQHLKLHLTQQQQQITQLIQRQKTKQKLTPQHISIPTPQLQSECAQLKLRSIILLQQINRLNHKTEQLTSYLTDAEAYIFRLQQRLSQKENMVQSRIVETSVEYHVPQQVETQMAKLTLRVIFLLEEINRLNYCNRQVNQTLVNAESYILKCVERIQQLTQRQGQRVVQYRIPHEVQTQVALLASQNQRISNLIRQNQYTQRTQQTNIQQIVEDKLTTQFESKISLLQEQNQRLRAQLNRSQQLREQLHGHLITAQSYIRQTQSRLNSQTKSIQISEQVEAKLSFLSNQNNNLNQSVTRLQQENQQLIISQQQSNLQCIQKITQMQQEIQQYKLRIDSYQGKIQQLTNQVQYYQQEINTYSVKIEQFEKVSQLKENNEKKINYKLTQQHLKAILLIQEINRLNHKITTIQTEPSQQDNETPQLLKHLEAAQTYIQQLQAKYTLLEQKLSTKETKINQNTTISNNLPPQSKESQLQQNSQIQISQRDLRILFLLSEIDRLNKKVQTLSSTAQLSGTTESRITYSEIKQLKEQKLRYQLQLKEVLEHLQRAEEYIAELLEQNQAFGEQRQSLIKQLTNIHTRK